MGTDRGQAITLEAFTGALLLISGIIFALQATVITPLTASTSSQYIENQQTRVATGLLDTAIKNDSLRDAVLNWNETSGEFTDISDRGYYTHGGPTGTTFGSMLNRTFRDRGFAFNVYIIYLTSNGELRTLQMVNYGTPSDNAVSARRTITLFDNETLTGPSPVAIGESTTFFAPDIAPDTDLHSVIQVEVVVWRM